MRICTRCDQFAPGVARHALAALPQSTYGWVLGDAMLVASELVSNAVRHSRCSREEMLTLSVREVDDRLEISVCDPGRSGAEAELGKRSKGEGGLGLVVVDELSARWGSERQDHCYRVWAEIPLTSRS
jgi:anti-sigma regulatory factor (Ser/Thr protein kinase)